MKTECPHCGQHYEVEENFAGQNVECSQCGRTFTVSAPEKTRRCPMCGEEILAVAKKCKHCGELLDDAGQPIQKKSRAAYILFGLFFGGLGVHNFMTGDVYSGVGKVIISGMEMACLFGFGERGLPAASLLLLCNTGWIILDLINGPSQKKVPAKTHWRFILCLAAIPVVMALLLVVLLVILKIFFQ